MKILIHTRNAALAEDFKTIVEEKLHETNPHQGKHKHKVILTSHGSGPLLRAEAAEFNDLAAFDSAIKTFALQIRKIHERTKDHDRTIHHRTRWIVRQ